jgi:hypothetical protein
MDDRTCYTVDYTADRVRVGDRVRIIQGALAGRTFVAAKVENRGRGPVMVTSADSRFCEPVLNLRRV